MKPQQLRIGKMSSILNMRLISANFWVVSPMIKLMKALPLHHDLFNCKSGKERTVK